MKTRATVASCVLACAIAQSAWAGSASVQVQVRAVVLGRTVIDDGVQRLDVPVTEADIARGFTEVPVPFAFRLRSNTDAGALLRMTAAGDWFRALSLETEDLSLHLEGGEAFFHQPTRNGMNETLALRVRVILSAHTAPGTYALPLAVHP